MYVQEYLYSDLGLDIDFCALNRTEKVNMLYSNYIERRWKYDRRADSKNT